MHPILHTVFLALFYGVSEAAQTPTILATRPAATAAVPFARTIFGLSIEFCYITDYLGDVDSPNALSLRLLQNIQDLIGEPPVICIGGNTEDSASYCDTCTTTLQNAQNVTFNKNLFKVLNENVPSDQKFIFGLNLKQSNLEIPLKEVEAVQQYLQPTRLLRYELGNEPDAYGSIANWNGNTYTSRIVDWIGQITTAIGVDVEWQIGGFAHLPDAQKEFAIPELVSNGIAQKIKILSSLSDHTYPFSVCGGIEKSPWSLLDLMSHNYTTSYFSQWASAIAAAKSIGVPFVMGETGSASCHGKSGVSNTFGAALWEIDYVLTGATMGMSAIHFHMGTGYWYSMWQPVAHNGVAAKISPPYYALLLMANAISNISNPYIIAIPALATNPNLAIYVIYSSIRDSLATPSKIIVLNLEYYGAGSGVTRQSLVVDLSQTLGGNSQAKFTRLTASSADALSGVTFGGQSWEGSTGAVQGTLVLENLHSGQVTLLDSEAVLVEV